MHYGVRSRDKDGSIGLTDRQLDDHRGGIEEPQERAPRPQLISFFGVSERVIPEHVLKRHHARNRRSQGEFLGIALLARHGDLLPVSLQFQDSNFSRFRYIVEMIRPLKAGHMGFGIFQLHLIFFLVDFTQDRPFANLDLRLLKVGLCLLKIGNSFLGVALMLRLLLLHLMSKVVVFGLGLAGKLQFVGPVELGEQIPGMNCGAVLNERGQREIATLAFGSGHLYLNRAHGLNRAAYSYWTIWLTLSSVQPNDKNVQCDQNPAIQWRPDYDSSYDG
jgi:hypothetical protein